MKPSYLYVRKIACLQINIECHFNFNFKMTYTYSHFALGLIPEDLRTTPAPTVPNTSPRRVPTDRPTGLEGAVSPSPGNSSAVHTDSQGKDYHVVRGRERRDKPFLK